LVEAGHSQCNNAGMVEKIISSSKWYYVLTFGLIINFFVVVILLVYILRRRARKGKAASLLGGSKGSRYTPVGKAAKKVIGKAASTLPFREYEESSSEVEDFMKPYSDEPEDSPTFMGAYRDQEDED